MKRSLFLACIWACLSTQAQTYNSSKDFKIWGTTSIGKGDNTPTTECAVLDIGYPEINKGVLLPRITDTLDVINPIAGLVVYLPTNKRLYIHNGLYWDELVVKVDIQKIIGSKSILNQSALQSNSNYNIDGKGTNKTALSAGLRYNNFVFNPLDTTYYFGTSITLGIGAGAGLRYSTKTIAGSGGKERNYGIGSSTMEQGIPPRPLSARSMIDTLDGVPVKNARGRLIVIEYGLNDMGCNAPGYDTVKFKRDYRIALDTIKARGWSMKDVLLFGPEYIPDSGYRKYAAINSGNGVPTLARHLQYVDAVRSIALEYGTHWFNMYDSMKLHGGAAIIGADSLHPNNAGHNYMASVIIDYLKKNYGSDVNSSLFVDSTKVTSPKIIAGNTLDDGTFSPLQVTGNVSFNGSKTIIGDLIGAFTGEVAVTRGGDTYTSNNYGGFHIQPSGVGNTSATVIGTVGRGTVRAGVLYFQTSNQFGGGAKTYMVGDTSGNIGIGNFSGANLPRSSLDILSGTIKIRKRIIGDPLTDSVLVISAVDSTIRTLGVDQIAPAPSAITASNGLTRTGDDIALGGIFGDDGNDRIVMGDENKSLYLRGTYINNYSSDDYTSQLRVRGTGITLNAIDRIAGGNSNISVSSTTGVAMNSVKGESITTTNGDNTSSVVLNTNSSNVLISSASASTGHGAIVNISSTGNSSIVTDQSFQVVSPSIWLQGGIQSDSLKNNGSEDSILTTNAAGKLKLKLFSLTAASITSGLFAPARLGTGTGTSANFLRGDQAYTNELLGGLIATATSGAQYTNQYDASNKLTITTGSTGTTTYALTGTSPVNSFSQTVNVLGGISTATSNTGANFYAPGLGTPAATTAQNSLFGGATLVAFRAVLRGNTSLTLTANENATNLLVGKVPFTTAATGIHNIITGFSAIPPTITNGGAPVKNLSGIYANNPYTSGMRNFSIHTDTGDVFIKDRLILGNTPAAASTDLIMMKGSDSVLKTLAVLPAALGGTGLTALGSSLQQLRVNSGATALEYFTPVSNTELSGTIYGDGTMTAFPTGVSYIILKPTGHNTIDLSTGATYIGAAGRVAMIFNSTNYTFQISGVTISNRFVYVVWGATNSPSFINL